MRSFISNLRLAHKFLFIGIIAALMLALPSSWVVRDNLHQLQTARTEATGIAPAGDTLELIRLTQQHRGLSAGVLAGNTAMATPRDTKKAEVDRALDKVRASVARLEQPELVREAGKVLADWQSLAAAVASKGINGGQSFGRHTTLIADQLALLEDISHATGIVLEADAATYYLQSAVLLSLPKVTEDLGQMRARGAALLTRGEASPEDKARFESMDAMLQRHYRETDKMLGQVGLHNPAMRKTLEAPLTAARTAANEARTLMSEHILGADKLSYPAGDYFAAYTRAIDVQFKLIDAGFGALSTSLEAAARGARRDLTLLGVGLLGLASLALWAMWLATRTTTDSVGRALRLAEAVAAGDLSTRVQTEGRDEIARLLRALGAMNQGLVGVVTGVRLNAESVATASSEIAQGNQDLSGRTEQQAAALEQTAATMDQLGATVRHTADNARQANQLAQGACGVAQRGSAVVGQVVETMKGINANSRKIADIIGTINGIAFQTNILALNAAVEAARAGEQGRGFAVVAGEVRLLAQRSADAAREIRSLITASVESVEQGTTQVDLAGATMGEVVTAIQRVTDIVGEISSACTEQSTGVGQVGEAVTQMDQATQQNAALVEQSAAAAESLRQQARQLVDVVAVFKLGADASQLATPV